ncbi:LysR family transcriptional regulator [Salipiger abyssi]|uniref:LysR family transcriptional regulator n=1 Tax=Salipiger abyssi TaxID=1250539 RepID=UPI001A8E274A|nr:LysR family transcriptional regulator [Salipiger abyssi]MBN9886675.1 LysR family transcriptional regulator [Salipiger abyssi]
MSRFHLNLTMLRVLDALADEGGHTRAADKLGMTQSGVSHAMRAWEDLMGGPLTIRRGRGVVMTPLGAAVLSEARSALEHIHAIGHMRPDLAMTGHVRLGSVASAAIAVVPRALEVLRRQHPAVTVEVIEGTDTEIANWFSEGIIDVAVSMADLSANARLLTKVELVGVMPEHHPLAHLRALGPSDLSRFSFVMSASGCEDAISCHMSAAGAALDVVLRIRDTRALLAAVRASLGISILPSVVVLDGADGLVSRPLDPPLQRSLWLDVAVGATGAAQAVADKIGAVAL